MDPEAGIGEDAEEEALPLHEAAARGAVHVLRHLLDEGNSVDRVSKAGSTALHCAAENGHIEVCKWLLAVRACTELRDWEDCTALHVAAKTGQAGVCALIAATQRTTVEGEGGAPPDIGGFIDANLSLAPLLLAARHGHAQACHRLLEAGEPVGEVEKNGWTALHLAAGNGHVDTCEQLLLHGADLQQRSAEYETPLHLAAAGGLRRAVSYLIDQAERTKADGGDQGAELELRDGAGKTPFHRAAEAGHADMCRDLLQRYRPDSRPEAERLAVATTQMGETALHLAAREGHNDVCKLLCTKNQTYRLPELLHMQTLDGSTALHLAASQGHAETVELLLSMGANVLEQSNDGSMALHCAARGNHNGVCELLMRDMVPAVHEMLMSDGSTPLHEAAKHGAIAAAIELCRKDEAALSSRQRDGWTPLHTAAAFGMSETCVELVRLGAVVEAKVKLRLDRELIQAFDRNATEKDLPEELQSNLRTPLLLAASLGHRRVCARLLGDAEADIDAADKDGKTALHLAAAGAHEVTCRNLIIASARVDARDVDENTPLHLAAECGKLEVCRLLLIDGKASVSAVNKEKDTPLHLAAHGNHSDACKELLALGADVDACNEYGWTPLHSASSTGAASAAKALVEGGAAMDARNSAGATPLLVAVHRTPLEDRNEKNQQLDRIRSTCSVLLEAGADIDIRSNDGSTALYRAAQNGFADICNLLLDEAKQRKGDGKGAVSASGKEYASKSVKGKGKGKGAGSATDGSADTINASDKSGLSPLHVAAQNGHVEVCKTLIDHGATLGAQEENGATPLFAAAQRNHKNVCELLISKKAVVDAPNKNNATPLYIAAQNGNHDVCKFLIDKAKAKVDFRNINNATPLYVAAQNGHKDTCELLIEHGAYLDAQEKNGATPLYIAAQMGHGKVCRSLLNPPGRKEAAMVNKGNKNGATPLHIAAQNGKLEACRELHAAAGVNVDAQTNNGITPLHSAAITGHIEIVEELISKKPSANLALASSNKKTALHWAAQIGHADICQKLIDAGADIDARTDADVTPLHLAAQCGNEAACSVLLKAGAGVEVYTQDGLTPFKLAVQQGHKGTANIIAAARAEQKQAMQCEVIQDDRSVVFVEEVEGTHDRKCFQKVWKAVWKRSRKPRGPDSGADAAGRRSEEKKGTATEEERVVTVKQLCDGCKLEAHRKTVDMLSRLRHLHVVGLLAWHPKKSWLVYEHLEHGTLRDRLADTANPLDWRSRLRVGREISLAMVYLHGADPRCLHPQLWPTNILMDKNDSAKLSDVGINQICPQFCSRPKGYSDVPEASAAMQDVYAMGVVLFELLLGKPPPKDWMRPESDFQAANRMDHLDPLAGQWPQSVGSSLFNLAMSCCNQMVADRPPISFVEERLDRLYGDATIQPALELSHGPATDPPPTFICPITRDLMIDPVVAADGYTYEREAIVKWMRHSNYRSPMTNALLTSTVLHPNNLIRSLAFEWVRGRQG